MMSMPANIEKWTEIRKGTGRRFLKDNAPEDIRKQAVEWERKFFESTARRRLVNVDLTAH